MPKLAEISVIKHLYLAISFKIYYLLCESIFSWYHKFFLKKKIYETLTMFV